MSQVCKAVVREWRARAGGVAVLALAMAALAPAAASAAPPKIDQGPRIAGTPQVGQTLQAVDHRYRNGTASWRWGRCTGTDTDDCREIPNARSTSYKLAPGDQGHMIRVLLIVTNADGYRWSASAPTARVAAAPPPPKPTPTPTPSPSPSPQPEPSPEPEPEPSPSPAPEPAPVGDPLVTSTPDGDVLGESVAPLQMLSPTPLVRIRGVMTRTGVRVSLLTVRAPKGSRITLRCRGGSCPAKRWAGTAALVRVLRFERRLRAGTRLTITVTKAGRIGKHTTIVIRRNKTPERSDRCLYPGARKPVACPVA